MRVLVVEDERVLATRIAEGLREQAMAVDVAFDGTTALDKAAGGQYDIVVLDRDLPGVHGDRVCAQLIAGEHPPRILMLTAADELRDRVTGLELGADDYLGKPFAFSELVARIRALGRRPAAAVPPVLTHGDLAVDTARHQVTRGGVPITLRPKEFAVLETLLRANGRPVSAEELLRQAWDEHADPFTNTVGVTIARLRHQLGDPPVIVTVPRVGYRI